MGDVLRRVGELLPFLAVGIALVGGVSGIRSLRGPALQGRSDRRAAAAASIVLALIAAAIAAVFTALIGSAWGGSFIAALPVAAVMFGAPVAIIVLASSITGYTTAARLRPRSSAAAGAVAGPLVLGAACLLAISLVDMGSGMVADAGAAAERDELLARSSMLHVAIDNTEVDLGADGLVQAVRLRVTLRSDAELVVAQLPGKLTYPLFTLRPGSMNDPDTEIMVEAPVGSPDVLIAGEAVPYELLFDFETSGTPTRSAPGTWLLELRLAATDGQVYGLDVPIAIAAD